ncbi:MAG TPA: gamma-glutamyltransferase [Dictyobacter sp.]|nr:gamma-glutamyltransferase [Dictyobacter sp.]
MPSRIAVPGDRGTAHYPSRRSVVACTGGMVATSHPLAAQAGLDILKAGGNAFDAAIATAATLNVVEPMSTGIGGDAFALFYSAKDKQVRALNGSGRAPRAATPAFFHEKGYEKIPLDGIFAVSVPGAVDAWDTTLRTYGTMSFQQVLTTAIRYAEQGFPVTEIIADQWSARASLLRQNEAARKYYLTASGEAPTYGTIFKNPALAKTFHLLAEEGRDAFYRGSIAQEIVRASEQLGGWLALEDFDQHFSTWEEPISCNYRGYTVYECPPNGQGLIALIALNTLSSDNLAALGPDSADTKHLQIEAVRSAMADGYAYICDPAVNKVPVQDLLTSTYAQQRRAAIPMDRIVAGLQPGTMQVGEDTVYLTVVDAEGNAASFINSLYYSFGSGVVAGDTGIMLQNRGAGFSLQPDHPNYIAPGKRPFHTIIPCMVLRDQELWSSMGVMGGHMQPQGHVQVLNNMIDFGMTPQQALDAPRFEIDVNLQDVAIEATMSTEIREELVRRGHHIAQPTAFPFGGGQVIRVDPTTNARFGGSDPRKDGCALGY